MSWVCQLYSSGCAAPKGGQVAVGQDAGGICTGVHSSAVDLHKPGMRLCKFSLMQHHMPGTWRMSCIVNPSCSVEAVLLPKLATLLSVRMLEASAQ